MPLALPVSDAQRATHLEWLLQVTQLPTASGREWRVIDWVKRWAGMRPDLALSEDAAGNLTVSFVGQEPSPNPVYFTAHLDHPAFVVERVVGPATVELSFRGGVMDEYFEDARVVVHTEEDRRYPATLTGRQETTGGSAGVFKHYLADLDADGAEDIQVGDVATWELPEARIEDGTLYTNACDDLAALAAAVGAYEVLREARGSGHWRAEDGTPVAPGTGTAIGDVRLLFTRAEEIGFVGALGAVREKTMPPGSRVIALENSRSFDDSPIGGGPIVRVGDRLSIFSPGLTGAIAQRAEQVAEKARDEETKRPREGGSSSLRLSVSPSLPWKWQRKLMAGGACEATVFCAYGYEATCVCLPLGNYHNMADLAAVQAGTFAGRPRVGPEFIGVSDFHGLVDLLVACGVDLPAAPNTRARVDKLWDERRFVLETGATRA